MTKESELRLNRWALQAAARSLLPRSSVACCLRIPLPQAEGVEVWYSEEYRRAHFKGLVVCGSVWACPICAAKITERRRVELSGAIDRTDYQFALVTFTLQHSRDDKVSVLLDDMLESWRWMTAQKSWKQFDYESGLVGFVRSLEDTCGVNGHHPHQHCLMVFLPSRSLLGVSEFLKSSWLKALDRHERTASYQRGCDFRYAASDVATYVAKWGREPRNVKRPLGWSIEHELTKGPAKLARGDKGLSPLELLSAYMAGDKQAGAIWIEYALAFKGRHQLQWSRGLRDLLGIGKEESDQEVAERGDTPSSLLYLVNFDEWRLVLANDVRGELIEVAGRNDVRLLRTFLDSLKPAKRSRQDRVRGMARVGRGRGVESKQ